MLCHHYILWTSVLSTCFAVTDTGCRRESSPPVQATSDRPAAEASFEDIVRLVKDGMELPGGSATGFVVQSTGASSHFQVHNTVSSQLIAPTTPDEPYRGKITITSQSVYSLHRSAESDDKKRTEDQDTSDNGGFGSTDDSDDSYSGFNSFDQGLVADSSNGEKFSAREIETVQRHPDKVDRTYDFVYRNGRWEFTTKLDPQTEASVENAFQRALRLQP